MCGLAGVLTSRGSTAEELSLAATRMSDALRHRGPDDSGLWIQAQHGLAFGFRRLSIIDLSQDGHQPMHSPSGRFTIQFNGEIYNYRELRRELEAEGGRFRGQSDTEVMLAAVERWGVQSAVRRFAGMFAIALWDAQQRRLHLIRDRLGIKPLFVYWRPGLLTFASELKAIVAGPGFDRSLDPDALTEYLRYLYVPAPHTIYRHARKVLPGHILTVADPREPLPEPVPYWSLGEVASRGLSNPLSCSEEEAITLGDRLIQETVAGSVYADVPVGAFLSGGIDSSLVVSCMQSATNRPVRTFSIAFREKEYNEADLAAEVARYLGTDHTELTLTADDARAVVPRLAEIFDEPFASPSAIPNLLVSRLARREVTVALSGAGGDELFAGYNRYTYGARLLGSLNRVPRAARRLSAAAIGSIRPGTWDRLYGVAAPALPRPLRHRLAGTKLSKLGMLLDEPTPSAMYRSLVSAWLEPEQLVTAGREHGGLLERVLDGGLPDGDWLDRVILADQLTYLPDDQLAMVDRASMAVSLEVRVPILEPPVVEFAWRLPHRLKIRNGSGKWLLRHILYRRVPRALVDRPKMGLSVPIDEWLRGPLRAWADDLLDPTRLQQDGILRAAPIRAAWDAFQAGHHTALPLWTALIFQAWKEHWLS